MSSPNLQPTLEGPRLTIRPIQHSDWEGLYAAASDPLVWEQHPAKDRYKENEFRLFFDDAIRCGSALTFVHRESGKLIGSSRYNEYDADRSEIEIGWTFLGRDYWGGSYNREIKKLMLEHAYTFVDTVLFWVGDDNMRSQKAVEKIGGVKRDGMFSRKHGDVDFPYVVFELKKTNYNL
ncbi:MAG: GNAT family N-acetyltransferase [Gammaproteobacteria bacterium]